MAIGILSVTKVNVGSSATLIVAERPTREYIRLYNGGTTTVYLGGSAVTPSTGFPLLGSAHIDESYSRSAYWGVTSAGSADVNVMEIK